MPAMGGLLVVAPFPIPNMPDSGHSYLRHADVSNKANGGTPASDQCKGASNPAETTMPEDATEHKDLTKSPLK